jgi:rhodanese-related sulfurtransferase
MRTYLLYFTLTIFSLAGCSQQSNYSLTADEFELGLQQPNIQLLDVRTASEYNTGHLKNALQANYNNRAEFNDRVQHLDKNKVIYVYCLSGVRSLNALAALREQGFTKLYHLSGGINAWKQKSKPVEAASNEPQLTIAEYQQKINADSLVLVDFGAEWCPPCKKMEPIITSLLKEMPNVKLVKVDGGIHLNVMQQLNVEALPVFIVYKNGKLVWRKQGIVSAEELKMQLK